MILETVRITNNNDRMVDCENYLAGKVEIDSSNKIVMMLIYMVTVR